MSRKLMAMGWVCALGMAVLLAGCPKKEPEPVPPPPPPVEEPEPPQEVPPPPAPEPVDETPDPLSQDLVTAQEYAVRMGLLGDVYFDFDKFDLKAEARDRLDRNAKFMRDHPEFTFTIEGHCDERGTNEYNLALGDRRASAAQDYLASLGIDVGRLQTRTYGEERPVCTESNEACWQRNRRAHFVITGRTGG